MRNSSVDICVDWHCLNIPLLPYRDNSVITFSQKISLFQVVASAKMVSSTYVILTNVIFTCFFLVYFPLICLSVIYFSFICYSILFEWLLVLKVLKKLLRLYSFTFFKLVEWKKVTSWAIFTKYVKNSCYIKILLWKINFLYIRFAKLLTS